MCLLWLENRECRGPDPAHPQKALGVKLPDRWSRADAVFDDDNLVTCAGLVPLMGLAERTGLSELIGQRVRFKTSRVASAGTNPAGKLTSIVAGSRGRGQPVLAGRVSSRGMRRRSSTFQPWTRTSSRTVS